MYNINGIVSTEPVATATLSVKECIFLLSKSFLHEVNTNSIESATKT